MTTPEIGQYYDAMTRDMSFKLGSYYQGLRLRYGDAQQMAFEHNQQQAAAERQRIDAEHTKAERTASLLKDDRFRLTSKAPPVEVRRSPQTQYEIPQNLDFTPKSPRTGSSKSRPNLGRRSDLDVQISQLHTAPTTT